MDSRVFEDRFMEIQTDMIEAGLELSTEEQISKVCIYGYSENGCSFANALFVIGDRVCSLGHVRKLDDETWAFLDVIGDDLLRLERLCKESDRPCPTELRLIYDVETGTLNANYQYERIRTSTNDPGVEAILDAWEEDIQKQLDEGKTDLEIHVSEPKKKKNWLKWWKK